MTHQFNRTDDLKMHKDPDRAHSVEEWRTALRNVEKMNKNAEQLLDTTLEDADKWTEQTKIAKVQIDMVQKEVDDLNRIIYKQAFIFKCPSCKEDYNDEKFAPRILTSCGHTFCHACLTMMIENKAITCPKDEQITYISAIEKLPQNFALKQ